ncbi:uncharacterized protein LOC131664575 isoform X2 [Phymastichus coffea]|uniref:uncharacterized protein LOC131664575 isoform X2 n=1 Tax=Phymastichus coffea TaxID=108790 RepID=UPI00273C397C|nr:uncharacterized protein LOC131664575 isoform X2 [Phymastichus coffea]
MWLKIIRQNISQLARRAKGSASIEQKNGNGGNNKASKTNNNGAEVNRNEEQNGLLDKHSLAKKKPAVPGGGPLLQQTEISTSQLDFFKMLDEKIESGPDYDESSDASQRREHIDTMLRRWELASASWSSSVAELNRSNSLQAASSERYQVPSSRLYPQQLPSRDHASYKSPPSAIGAGATSGSKDRERPERARFDGLHDVASYHCPSPPSMPRHVLEPISQSPTQSLRPPPGAAGVVSVQPSAASSIDRYSNAGYSPNSYNRHEAPPGALIGNSPGNPYVHQFQIQSRNRVT